MPTFKAANRSFALAVLLSAVLTLLAAAALPRILFAITPTLTPTFPPNPPTGCRADFNFNGRIDFEDIDIFVKEAQKNCQLPPQSPTPQPTGTTNFQHFPPPAICASDFNLNGDIDISDLQVVINEAQSDCTITQPTLTPTDPQACYSVADHYEAESDDEDALFIFNPVTGEDELIGKTGTDGIEASALGPRIGVLYAVDKQTLGRLDMRTGRFSPIAEIGREEDDIHDIDSLAYDWVADTLFGITTDENNPELLQIDPDNGRIYSSVRVQSNAIDAIAIDPDRKIFAIAKRDSDRRNSLITIDPATGTTNLIAELNLSDIEGLGSDPAGRLYGVSGRNSDQPNLVVRIDKTNGDIEPIGSFSSGEDFESIDCK